MRLFRQNNSISPNALPTITQMRIVCGDCAGEKVLPNKTNLTSDGACADCGGRSFVCATRLGKVLARHLLSQTQEEVDQLSI